MPRVGHAQQLPIEKSSNLDPTPYFARNPDLEGILKRIREQGAPVFPTFSIAYDDLEVRKINILHPQTHAFHKA
jgi:hypothetical protein